jgi:hypothetical protein
MYIKYNEYPLGQFAAWVSSYDFTDQFLQTTEELSSLVFDSGGNVILPNRKDVTELYIRQEKVADIMCDVFQSVINNKKVTFWVDPATGLTLKLVDERNAGNFNNFEVTKLTVGSPDWNGKHLHPITGDTFTDVD